MKLGQCKDYLSEHHLPVTWVKSDLVEGVRDPNILGNRDRLTLSDECGLLLSSRRSIEFDKLLAGKLGSS